MGFALAHNQALVTLKRGGGEESSWKLSITKVVLDTRIVAVTFLWAKNLHILHTSQCGESIIVLKVLGLPTYSYGHFH